MTGEGKKLDLATTRKILLFGCTGQGKSTLGNLLINKGGNFEEVFKVSSQTSSETKKAQTSEFAVDSINYQVIDFMGTHDTKEGNSKEFLNKMVDSFAANDYLNQVLFVAKDRFNEKIITAYELLKEMILDQKPGKFITIVRTGFSEFEDEEACQEDKKSLMEETSELAEIINSCNGIIYVDNPAKVGLYNREEFKEVWEKIWQASREKLLKHLAKCQDTYQVAKLDKFKKKTLPNLVIGMEIKIEELNEKLREQQQQQQEEEEEEEIEENTNKVQEVNDKNTNKKNYSLLIFLIISLIVLLVIWLPTTKKKRKKITPV